VTGFRIDTNVEMPMRDGTLLRAEVWRPDDDAPHPALVMRTPYQKEESTSDFFRADAAMRAGYAVVAQDVRGRFSSDGEWDGLKGAVWEQERPDTYDTIEWVAAQPWCDGNVGLFGLAHTALYSFVGAETRPPHLRAAVAVMTGSEDQRNVDSGGAVRLQASLATFLFCLVGEIPQRLADGTMSPEDAARIHAMLGDVERVADFLPLSDLPTFHDLPDLPMAWADFLDGTASHAPHAFAYEEIETPLLVVGGWYDLACGASVDQFQQLRARSGGGSETRGAHRLIMGPWTHGDGEPNQGEVDFGYFSGSWAKVSVQPRCLAFFDRHLKHVDDDAAPVRYFLMGANQWCDATEWPPVAATPQTWYLHSGGRANGLVGDGTLTLDPPTSDEHADTYRYDPLDPVRTRGGRCNRTTGAPGPLDQSIVERRADVLCYTSEVLTEPLDIVGDVALRLYASSSAVDTDFFAKLLDVLPDGRVLEIASGLVRARFRKGYDREVLLDPGVVEDYDINLGPTAARILPGHRLRVHVCSSNFPYLDRNMNSGNKFGVDAEGVVAEQTVFHDSARPSSVELRVLGSAP
jgi:putative CocE/NonD family hydrolase